MNVDGEHVQADPARIAQGWTGRFIVDPRRAEEEVRLYRELGFEVVADPVDPAHMANDCRDCRLLLEFKMIYTRRAPARRLTAFRCRSARGVGRLAS